MGIHPHVKGTSTRKLLVWALSAIATNTHPSGAGFPLSSRRLRGSQPCGCTSPETGNDLLSSFPRPAEAGHMVGVAQRKSGGPQNRLPRVRIPPRPPRRIRCAGCQKWKSPNLSKADSRQRPPAGIEPCPAVIWDSSSVVRAIGLIPPNGSPVRVRPVPPTPKPCVVHGSGLMPCPDGSIRLTKTSLLSE